MDFIDLAVHKKKTIVLENTKLGVLGRKRENVRTDRRKLQDAEFSN
jgi:hypothetical protein